MPFTYVFPSDVVVQGHRGDIIEGIGCVPTIKNVSLAYLLSFVWPPIIALLATIYAFLSFRAFLRRRKTIDELFTSGSSLSKDNYLRLICFSLIPLLVTFPLTLFFLIVNIIRGPQPWISWEDTHSNFNRFNSYSAAAVEANPLDYAAWVVDLWTCTVCWVLFTIFLGMGNEQRKQYRRWFFFILRPFGVKPSSSCTDSPTVWQGLFGRSITPLRVRPTPSAFDGVTGSLPTFSVPHVSKASPKKLDLMSIGGDSSGLNDDQEGEREENGNHREDGLKAEATNWDDHENASEWSKDGK